MNVKFVIYITLIFAFVSSSAAQLSLGVRRCNSPDDCHQKCDAGFRKVCRSPTVLRLDGCFCEKIEPDICKTDSDCKKLLPTCDTKYHDILCTGPKCLCYNRKCSSKTDCDHSVCYMDADFNPRYPACNAKHACGCVTKHKDTLKECETFDDCAGILGCPKQTPAKRCFDNRCYCIKSCNEKKDCLGDSKCLNGFCVADTLTFD